MTTKTLLFCLALASSTLASGCARGYDIKTPDGFAELDGTDDYGFRATSAEGVVLAVRKEKNDPEGSLDFWASAVKNDLDSRGYALASKKSVKSKNGTPGTQLRYSITRNGRPNVLWVTVFVAGKRVVLVEAGGDEAHFELNEKRVQAAIEAVEVG